MINILLCDDCKEQVILLQQLITDYEKEHHHRLFRIFCTNSSNTASLYIKKYSIDAAILDIDIDVRSGIDLAKLIKATSL